MIAVREERIRIGATELEQKTVIAASPDGLVCPTTLISYMMIFYIFATQKL